MSIGISAIIPVREGSKRLKHKNILPFGDSNLLIHKIRQLKKVEGISEIIVSSDSKTMLDMARSEGVATHKRKREFADERTKSFSELIEHLASDVGSGEHILYAPCVCPLCDEKDLANAIEVYGHKVIESREFDSVISVRSFKEYLWDSFKPINYRTGIHHTPSQNLPEYFVVVNGFYLAARENMRKWRYFFGTRPYQVHLPQAHAIDIDTEFDYICAKAWYAQTQTHSRGGGQFSSPYKQLWRTKPTIVIFTREGSVMKILITGGAGFIGTALARKLTDLAYEVSLLDLPQKFKSYHKEYECYEVDIRQSEDFKVLEHKQFSHIFHLAAQTSGAISQENPTLDVDTNVKGTLNVCNFARACGAQKIIFSSSMATYGNQEGNISESTPLTPLSNYGVSKLCGEAYIKSFGQFDIQWSIFRLFNVYGPGQDMHNLKQGMASIFMAQALTSDCIRVTGSLQRYRDFVYIDDVVQALLLGLEGRTDSQVYNVGSARATRVRELIECILSLCHRESLEVCNVGGHEGDTFGSLADITKLQSLGWSPKVSLTEGLSKMYAYARGVL